MRTCDAAVAVLRETNNPAVMWGDEGLCHEIANRAQLRSCGRATKTSDCVLSNLARCHDGLIAGKTTCHGQRRVRIFWLPEHAPEWARKGAVEEKRSVLEVAMKALLRAGFAIIGPSDARADDPRKVLLVGSRVPRSACSSAIVRAFSSQQSHVEFISYMYLSPDDFIDIETTNASFNRRTDLKPDVEKALERLYDEHVTWLLAALKKAKLTSRIRSTNAVSGPLLCDSKYFLRAAFEGGKAGFVYCERHRGHNDDHRGVYRKADKGPPGLFGDGRGLVWVNHGSIWMTKDGPRL